MTHSRVRGALVGLAIAAVACGGDPGPQAGPGRSAVGADGPVVVDLVRVVEQPLDVELSLPGELTAYQAVAIVPRVSGFVKAVSVDRGSRVQSGQVLATLDAPELVAQRSEAEARVQEAEAELSAARATADADQATFDKLSAAAATPGVVAGNDVLVAGKAAEASRSRVAAAERIVEAARQHLTAVRETENYLRVTAPFAGVISERTVHPGALVGPSGGPDGALFRLVDETRLRLVVPVPEAYTTAMQIGMPISFSVSTFPGQVFPGTIARVAHAVDVRTRTMAVEADVENRDGQLAPGMFCQVRWPVRRTEPSLFVPSLSVTSTTDRTFVIRVRDGRTEWVDVRTGLTAGSMVEVFGDLRSGDEVAGRGTDELRPGTAVRPREAKPAA